jgi:hypothetical protein
MTASCNHCDEEWERDPALEVACPSCAAEKGQRCRRPSGHRCRIHAKRDWRALEEVCSYSTCPAANAPGRPVRSTSKGTDDGETQQTTLSP